MKVTLLGHLHGFGGAEKSLVLLANELVARGHVVSLISFTSNNNKYYLDDKVDYFFIPDKGVKKIEIIKNRFFDLRDKLRLLQPDVVISFWFQLAVFGMMISKICNFKIIYSERGDPSDIEYNGVNGIIRALSFPFIDGFVFQTKGAQSFFRNSITKKSCVIHNAISLPDTVRNAKVKKEKLIVSVGRLHRQKNFPLLIKAFKEVHRLYPEYSLVIYGEGELRKPLESLVLELGLDDSVVLYGNASDVLNRMQKAEIFVLSSDFEGMPNVLMEAMALGLPCISTDCSPGGAAELIKSGENGILVPKGDQEKLFLAILDIIKSPQKADIMGREATRILTTHSPKAIYNQWEAFITYVKDDFKKRVF